MNEPMTRSDMNAVASALGAHEDWDGESYCVHDGCGREANHRHQIGQASGVPVWEMLCCAHADPVTDRHQAIDVWERLGRCRQITEPQFAPIEVQLTREEAVGLGIDVPTRKIKDQPQA